MIIMGEIARHSARAREIVRIIGDFVRYLWNTARGSVVRVLILTIARSGLEGYGLLLLAPLLNGISGAHQPDVGALASPVAYISSLCRCEMSQRVLLMLFLVLIVLRSLTGYMRQVTLGAFHAKVLGRLRENYYKALGNARWEYLVTRDPAKYSQALTRQADEAAYGVVSSASLLSAILSLAIGIAVALFISFDMTLLALTIGCLVALPLTALDLYHYRLSDRVMRVMTELYWKLNQHLGNLKFFKLRAEGNTHIAFVRISDSYSSAYGERMRVAAAVDFFHDIGAAAVLSAIVLLGQANPINSTFIVLVVIFARLVPRVNEVHSSVRTLLSIVPQYEDFTRELESFQQHKDGDSAGVIVSPILTKHLRFETVGYRYPNRPNRNALSNISFVLGAGKSLGVIGLSGAGKSTLADLAAGLLAPSEGRILLDDKALQADRATAWRQRVSYVLQDDPLINDTVAANIRLGRSDASDREIWDALKLVHADAMVRALPDGLMMTVGDRGQSLSKGQRQRICLARALISHPSLLILDECTSGLNPIDEVEFEDLFSKLASRTTIIMISHRPAALNWVDDVLVLKDGRIVEFGSPAGLRCNSQSMLRQMDLAEQLGTDLAPSISEVVDQGHVSQKTMRLTEAV